ncbi:MAG TPA: MlaD family protein [Thermoanaerobaculia bacterium]|nr:MlaD family protein [Thermoanaerobaculia bacterium]
MPRDGARTWRVGLLVIVALALLAFGIFLIGEESNLFSRKNHYAIYFGTAGGLNPGNPVQLDGVEVGTVRSVVLPTDAASSQIKVTVEVDRAYGDRIREDSLARIKTLGLLGDKFVELTTGSPGAEPIPPGGVIPAAPPTNVDQLIASGEDVMDNVVQISADLRDILQRTEQGEGLLGELTTESETGRRVTDAIVETMESVQRVARNVETGEGPLPRLIHDRELADRIDVSLGRLDSVLADLEGGDGLLPGLLHDPATREDYDATMARLRGVTENLEGFSRELQEGDGLLPRLLQDEELGDEITGELRQVLDRINNVARKLDQGEGTAGKLISDPSVYEAVQDVIVGVEESRMLRWLIRNRQKKGIEKRYEAAQGQPSAEPDEPAEPEEPEPAAPEEPEPDAPEEPKPDAPEPDEPPEPPASGP